MVNMFGKKETEYNPSSRVEDGLQSLTKLASR